MPFWKKAAKKLAKIRIFLKKEKSHGFCALRARVRGPSGPSSSSGGPEKAKWLTSISWKMGQLPSAAHFSSWSHINGACSAPSGAMLVPNGLGHGPWGACSAPHLAQARAGLRALSGLGQVHGPGQQAGLWPWPKLRKIAAGPKGPGNFPSPYHGTGSLRLPPGEAKPPVTEMAPPSPFNIFAGTGALRAPPGGAEGPTLRKGLRPFL